jgi:hypothetical protein
VAQETSTRWWHGYAMSAMIGVVLIPLSLLLDPRDGSLIKSLLCSAALYFTFSLVAGALTPGGAWRVGLFVGAPLVLFVGTMVFLVTREEVFVRRDLPVIAASLAAAVSGGWIGSRMPKAAEGP